MPPSKKEPSSDKQPKDRSDHAVLQQGGWEDRDKFMLSYGLKMHNDDDVQEGKAILQAYKDHDQRAYEEKQQGKTGK
jgi:hypothetical protein